MVADKKLQKLSTDLKKLGITQDEIAKMGFCTRPTLSKIWKGEVYNPVVIEKLIKLRDEKKEQAKTLEKAI